MAVPGQVRDLPGELVGAAGRKEILLLVLAQDAPNDGQRDGDQHPDDQDDHNRPKRKRSR